VPISGATAVPPGGLHSSVDSAMSALGGMDSQGFLNLLVAQLRYQSPLEPKDPGDLMTQTAVLAQLDATQQLLAAQQTGLGLQQAVAAAGLLGTTVTAYAQDGTSYTGVVEGIRYTSFGPVLDVSGEDVPLSAVGSVRRTGGAPPLAAPAPDLAPSSSDPAPSDPTPVPATADA
jgi:flagellar basal-body rod modification protein FlgD